MLPFMQLRDPDSGYCFTPFDNCLTLAAAGNIEDGPTGWDITRSLDCEDCCVSCEAAESYKGVPSLDGAWWAQTGDPAQDEILGILVDTMTLEPAASSRRRGASLLEPVPYTPRILEINGRILTKSRRATYIAETLLLERLVNICGSCDGWEITIRPFCNENTDEPIFNIWSPPPDPPMLDPEDVPECSRCGNEDPDYDPPRLPPDAAFPQAIDNGRRGIMRAKFVSLDTAESEVPLEYCFGKDIRIVFEIYDDQEWGDPIESVCLIDREFPNLESGRCRAIDWSECLAIPEEVSCAEDTLETFEDPFKESAREPIRANYRYCSPMYRSVLSCLTPLLPVATNVGLGIVVESGNQDMRNLRLDIYPAFDNMPSPETCKGEQFYRRMTPCNKGYLAFVPANSRVWLDGRRSQTRLSCYGQDWERAEGMVEDWDFPMLDPTCRFWIVATADCLNTGPDAKVTASFYPRWQS